VASSGTLLLAGILERQTEEIQSTYQAYLNLEVADCQDGWVLMRSTAL
jgi:ribosomal protein L11 methyltransferase